MKNPIAWLFPLIFIIACSQNNKAFKQRYEELSERTACRFMFYNVENLFDTIDDPITRDEEFTPEGSKRWTSFRYYSKLQKTAKVIIAVGAWQSPEIIGLCEIENRRTLEDLIRLTPLSSLDYAIIHKESPDHRGIDVGLLYKKSSFEPVYYDFIKIDFPFDPDATTRDILYAKGILKEKDTLHVFINHWPSRYGGKEQSAPRRIRAAFLLRQFIDSLQIVSPDASIIIAGDFNDEPFDKSISSVLGAGDDSTSHTALLNLMIPLKKKGKGSYKYQYEWSMIDQIIVSNSMKSPSNKLSIIPGTLAILKTDWLLEEDKRYPGNKPFRTYAGPRYINGYSDHLPVFVDINCR
jgi:predicted extracellular nuclease